MKISIKEILNYIAVFSLFSDALSCMRLPFVEIKIYYLIVPIILMLLFAVLKGLYLNIQFIIIVSIVLLSSYINILLGNNTFLLLAKQMAGILITSTLFYFLLKVNKYDVPKIFKIYLNLAFIVALIGVIQEISYMLDFRLGYDYSRVLTSSWMYCIRPGSPFIRINSILPEPAHFCNVMTPAFFVSIASLSNRSFRLQNNWRSAVIVTAFLLTFSTLGYIMAIFSVMLLLYNYKKAKYIFVVSLLSLLSSILVYSTVPEVKLRCQHTIGLVQGKTKLEDVNFSTYALAANALVAFNSFSHNPIFGSGLGSHRISHEKYITKYVSKKKIDYNINYQDAASLFLRLLSEAGLYGLIVFMVFILKHHLIKSNDKSNILWVINNAIMAYFVIRLIRNGHYFNEGFYLFVWMYYFSYKRAIQHKIKAVEA